jgi:hypothetical protein
MYSETTDRVFYLCCLCFDQGSRTSLANDGFNNWAHLSAALKSHESSSSHMKFYKECIGTKSRLKGGSTLDKSELLLIQKESESWKNVLARLMNITFYFVENNLAFQGKSDKLYT